MVRTKADVKACGGKSMRKAAPSNTPKGGKVVLNGGKSYVGGGKIDLSVGIPDWQKPITNFFANNGEEKENGNPESAEVVSSKVPQGNSSSAFGGPSAVNEHSSTDETSAVDKA